MHLTYSENDVSLAVDYQQLSFIHFSQLEVAPLDLTGDLQLTIGVSQFDSEPGKLSQCFPFTAKLGQLMVWL